MMINFIFKCLISFLILISLNSEAKTYVSLSPVLSEIIYALGGEDNLLGVSSVCNYPKQVKEKEIIGDTYFLNMEKMVKIKPNYIFSMNSNKPLLGQVSQLGIEVVYFEFNNINDIYKNIEKIGKIIDRVDAAQELIKDLKSKIENIKTKKPKKVLYVAQVEPLIIAGKKSYINDLIQKSGHISIASDINFSYPNITFEYLLKAKPDVIVVLYADDVSKIRRILPDVKIVFLTKYQQDIINRPGPRILDAVSFFANL